MAIHNAKRKRARAGAVIAGSLSLAAGQAIAADVHRFQVLLDGKPVGTHEFQVSRSADGGEEVASVARFDVKILGLTVYRYRHEARERWRDGCLTLMESVTRDNGRDLRVRAAVRDGVLQVETPVALRREGCVAGYAYWNRDRLLAHRELLNPQTGIFDAVRIEPVGEEMLEVGDRQQAATRYRLRGDGLSIDLWYSAQGEWLQLASAARGDRELLYRLIP